MAMQAKDIERLLREGIQDADVRIVDLRGDGEHYAAIITSPAFEGKTRVAQHRMVADALKGTLGNELHALQIHTPIPEKK